MFLPAYVPQPDSFNGLMRFFSTSEIAFIQAVLLAQRNNDKIWENRLFSPAGQYYEKIMKYITIYCDNHPSEHYQNIIDLLFPKVFECPTCRRIGIFKSKDWEDTEEKGENGKIKNQYVYTMFCGNCKADYSIKSSDISMKYIASQSNAELLNNEYHFSDNFMSEYKTASSYHKDQQVKALNLPYSEIGKAAGGVSRCAVHAPIKKLYANPAFMKVWELSENFRSQFNPNSPVSIHPLIRFLFPETFYCGIAALCDRELLEISSF
jgi:hypothetical protein